VDNAELVNNLSVETAVPAGAVFTDTTLTEAEVDAMVSNNGYLTSETGDMAQSIYDTDANSIVDNAELVNNLSVETAVPTGAVFTDTTLTEAEVDAMVANNNYLTSVSTGAIDDNAVTKNKIVVDAIDSSRIANGGIINEDIKGDAGIDGSKINPSFGDQTIASTVTGGSQSAASLANSNSGSTGSVVTIQNDGSGRALDILQNNTSGNAIYARSASGNTGSTAYLENQELGGTTMRVVNSGDGTALDMRGDVWFDGDNNRQIRIRNSTGANAGSNLSLSAGNAATGSGNNGGNIGLIAGNGDGAGNRGYVSISADNMLMGTTDGNYQVELSNSSSAIHDILSIGNYNLAGDGVGSALAFRGIKSGTRYDLGKITSEWTNAYQSGNLKFQVLNDFTSPTYLTAMTIDKDGNVGVGIATPGENLQVHESASERNELVLSHSTSGTGDFNGARLIIDTTSAAFFNYENGNTLIGPYTQYTTINSAGDMNVNGSVTATQFYGNGSNLTGLPSSPWTLNTGSLYRSTGNVSIGTSTLAQKLRVEDNAGASARDASNFILTSSAASGSNSAIYALTTGSGTGNYSGGYFQVDGTSGGQTALRGFNTATSTGAKIAVDGSATGANGVNYGLYGYAANGGTNWAGYFQAGNVLVNDDLTVGTTTPTAKLTVSEGVNVTDGTDGTFIDVINAQTGTTMSGVRFKSYGVASGYHKGGMFFHDPVGSSNFGRGDIHFAINNAADGTNAQLSDSKMTIKSSGAVGIGTTNPQNPLHLVESIAALDGSDGSFLDIQNLNNGINALAGLRFKSNTSIGPDAYKAGIFFRRGSNDGNAGGFGDIVFAVNTADNLTNVSTADEIMNVGTSGVDITGNLNMTGTIYGDGASFSQQVSMNNVLDVNNELQVGNGAGTSGYVLQSLGAGSAPVWNAKVFDVTFGTTDYIYYGAGIAAARLGLGTSSPSANLDIEGSTTTIPMVQINNTNTSQDVGIQLVGTGNTYTFGLDGSDGSAFKISDWTSLGTSDRLSISSTGNVTINGYLGLGVAPTAKFVVRSPSSTTTTDIVQFQNNAGTSVFVAEQNGEVGINVGVSPTAQLQVRSYTTTTSYDVLNVENNVGTDLFRVEQDGSVFVPNVTPNVAGQTDLWFNPTTGELTYTTGACPFLYVDNGDGYKIQTTVIEALAGKYLEGTHISPIKLNADADVVKLKIKLEEPEVSHLDYIAVVIVSASQTDTLELLSSSIDQRVLAGIDSDYQLLELGDEVELIFKRSDLMDGEFTAHVVSAGYYDIDFQAYQKPEWKSLKYEKFVQKTMDLDANGNLINFRPVHIINPQSYGYQNPASLLQVDGNLSVKNGGALSINKSFSVDAQGNEFVHLTTSSGAKMKMEQNKIFSLKPVTKEGEFLFDHIEFVKAFPELVSEEGNINANELIPLLVAAIQDQKQELDAREKQIQDLEEELSSQASRVSQSEAEIEKIKALLGLKASAK
ncbi:MAG: hypothetical protein JXQ90_11960, partial [Cyclobacteriaceae bacterium]